MRSARNEVSQARLAGNSGSDASYCFASQILRPFGHAISNRQWLARLENAVTRGKQTPEVNSNRHIRDACSVQTFTSISPRRRLSPFSIFTFPSSVAARRSSAISNRERLARLETMPNPLKIKAGHDF